MRSARGVVVAGIVAGSIMCSASSASASCVAGPPLRDALADAKIAFVGTVVRTSNDGRWARVSVDEVLKGARIPHLVQVRGSPAMTKNVVTTVDRRYVRRRTYLFVPYGRERRATFLDNACTPTTDDSSAIADETSSSVPPRS